MSSTSVRLVVVDDHLLVRDALAAQLERVPDFQIVGRAADGESAITRILEVTPDVCVLDLAMPRGSGLWVARRLQETREPPHMVLLTSFLDAQLARDGATFGVLGFVHKNDVHGTLEHAIREVVATRVFRSPSLREEQPGERTHLTPREAEVVRLVSQGLTSVQIGHALRSSPRTVETHRRRAMAKLGATSVADLVRYAIRVGIMLP